jgi:hypothetical protein
MPTMPVTSPGLKKSEQVMMTDQAADTMEHDDMHLDTVRVLVEP